jgi:hypothetical protein
MKWRQEKKKCFGEYSWTLYCFPCHSTDMFSQNILMFSLSRIPFCKTEICVNDHTNQSWDKCKALILLTTTSQKVELARECQCSKRKIDGSFISNIVRNSQHKKLNRNPHTVQISHVKEMPFFRPFPTCLRSYLSTLEYINNCPARCNVKQSIYYSANSLYIFGCQPNPSPGVHKTVTTGSGTGHIFCAAISLHRGQGLGHVGGGNM